MSMLAHFEEWSSEDRRRAMRRSLKLGIDGGGDKVTIHDLSLTGALLETNTPMLVGAAFELELPQAGSVEAVIVWNSGEYYGCQFPEPISPAALSAALLQATPQNSEGQKSPMIDPITELKLLNDEVERLAIRMESALKRLTND